MYISHCSSSWPSCYRAFGLFRFALLLQEGGGGGGGGGGNPFGKLVAQSHILNWGFIRVCVEQFITTRLRYGVGMYM